MTSRTRARIDVADCIAWAESYDGPPFHALLCDPPYELGFMGRAWDRSGIAFSPDTWRALARVLHPGAFGMAFASSRGWHRLAVAIEDAGLTIHPSIFGWAFGSGFPKATRIDTQVDKAAGAERPPDVDRWAARHPTPDLVGYSGALHAGTRTGPATPLAAAWASHRYGLQALKPALEPIIVFQKPYAGRPVDSIVATGAGALNVDGGRVPTGDNCGHPGGARAGRTGGVMGESVARGPTTPPAGRWPANLVVCHTPDCVRVGERRVRNASGPASGPTVGARARTLAMGAMVGERGAVPFHADADGLETVAAYACAPGCPVASLDSTTQKRYSDVTNRSDTCGEQCEQNATDARGNTSIGDCREAESYIGNSPIGGSGSKSTAPSLPDTTSTTSTAIQQTIPLATCSCSVPPSTSAYMMPSDGHESSARPTTRGSGCVHGATSGDPLTPSPITASGETCNPTAAVARPRSSGNGGQAGRVITATTCGSGGPSRFYHNPDFALDIAERLAAAEPVRYVAKASRRERNAGCDDFAERAMNWSSGEQSPGTFQSDGTNRAARNPHPTVKPLALVQHLATLLLPPDAYAPRRLCVPFAGSGSECIGAMLAGWDEVVGVELSDEYADIARARLAWWGANRPAVTQSPLPIAEAAS